MNTLMFSIFTMHGILENPDEKEYVCMHFNWAILFHFISNVYNTLQTD